MPKRIILCLDGTWDSVDQGAPNIPSNVARLSRMIARQGVSRYGDPIDQIVYYQSGIGTGSMNKLDKYYQGITGAGISSHLLSAYNFVATNYSQSDEIFLFGYSRGAYTARALGWFLTKLGVLKPEDLDLFPGLFRHFKRGSGRVEFCDDSLYEELRGWSDDGEGDSRGLPDHGGDLRGMLKPRTRVKTKPTPIEIVVEGVWETVGSLGLPESWFTKMTGFNKMYQFYNTALDDKVHNAFQALALDEHRGAFTPAIWYLEPKFKNKVNLKQCWFPGYHGEVGGGVAKPLKRNHLAIEDITLAWMCDQVDGLLTFDWNASRNVLGEIRENVKWGVTREKDPTGGIWNLSVAGGRSLRRTPGSYHKKPTLKRWKSGECTTNETIHPSVKLLVDAGDANYFPLGLDRGTTWKMLRIPRWKYIDKSETGEGGFWIRSAVLGTPSITIQEHVVRERPDEINFEAKLLPVSVQDMLHRRNLAEYEKMYASSVDFEESI